MCREGPGHRTPRIGPRARVFVGALLAIAAASPAVPGNGPWTDERCELCRHDLDVPVVPLTTAFLDSVAADHASFNEKQLARIDSLLRAGHWGLPEDTHARDCAHLLAQLSLANAYRDLVRATAVTDHVYEVDETVLADLYERYADVNLFIGARLAKLRVGRGRVCVRYSLEAPGEGQGWHGGRRLHWKVRDMRIEGRERRVLNVLMPSGQDGEIELLFAPHHTMAVSYQRSPGPPAPFEWFLVHDLEGVWVRKWGTHRPTAYMLWMSTAPPRAVAATSTGAGAGAGAGTIVPAASFASPRSTGALPSIPLLGLRIYVPGLKLRLPLLPDINVEDLREVEVIMPVLDLSYLRRGDHPDWLALNSNLGFEDWTGHGPLPPEIRHRFPDR